MKLSLSKYGWRCVLGGEILYFICLLGGLLPLRNAEVIELHKKLFEMLPGFAWISAGSVLLGAVYVFVFAWAVGAYMVWMYNSSIMHGAAK